MDRTVTEPRPTTGDEPRSSFRQFTRVWPWVLVTIAVADLVVLRSRALSHSPSVLAALFLVAIAALALRAIALAGWLRAPGVRRWTAAAEMLAVAGALVTLGAGTANWALGLQGYAILSEGESIRLRQGERLQQFEAGPLARLDEMDVVVSLDELDLTARGDGRFDPTSRLRVWRSHDAFDRVDVATGVQGVSGPLRFHQGAFGFAPRITILQVGDDRREVFDRVVPFVTERHGPDGLSFHGSFEIGAETMRVEGRIDLDSLDEALRGHATLWVDVARNGAPLGGGPLLPGHFAEIDDNYRVGFTDLRRWSEIVVTRRNYAGLMAPGLAATAVGWLLWPIARRKGR